VARYPSRGRLTTIAEQATIEGLRALQRATCRGGLIVDLRWADAKTDDGEPVSEYNSVDLGYSRTAAPACLNLERLGLIRRSEDQVETAIHVIFEPTPLALRVLQHVTGALPPMMRSLYDQLEVLAGGLLADGISPVEMAAAVQDRVIAAAAEVSASGAPYY